MLSRVNREAKLDGAAAAMRAFVTGDAPPANPFTPASKRHLYWQWGADRVQRLIADIAGGGA